MKLQPATKRILRSSIARVTLLILVVTLMGCDLSTFQTPATVSVGLLSDTHKGVVQVDEELVITSISSYNEGIHRVEFFVDDQLVDTMTQTPPFPTVRFIADHRWTPSGEKKYKIEIVAYGPDDSINDSHTFDIEASRHPIIAVATVLKSEVTAPTPTPLPTSAATSCGNKALLVEHVTVPIGTVFNPGAIFNKTWKIRNIGTCPWTTDYYFDNVSGPTLGGTRVNLPKLPVNGEINLTVSMKAPITGGTFESEWKLFDQNGKAFESGVPLEIVVPSTCEFPKINRFEATPAAISLGQNSTLLWEVEGATTITLNPGPQLSSNSGSATVAPDKTTTYILKAETDTCTAERELTVSLIPPSNSLPAAPSNLTVKETGQTTLTFTWVDNSNNETEFRLFDADTKQHEFTFAANTLEGQVTGLECGKQYRWQLYAYNGLGLSSGSNTSVVFTNAC
ncbi:MAG: NBR1-Ig-like domain-containing protein [Chloroflexota bacterium]